MKVIVPVIADYYRGGGDKNLPRRPNSQPRRIYLLSKEIDIFWPDKHIADNCSHVTLPHETDNRFDVGFKKINRHEDQSAQEKNMLTLNRWMSIYKQC